jgi:molybdenum cofactor cytidylyltransferase
MTGQKFNLIVLAAGNSTRMQGPNKLLTLWRGKSLVRWCIENLGFGPDLERVFVTGRDAPQVIEAAQLEPDWRVVHNCAASTGLASSLNVGLSAFNTCHPTLVLLGDMPRVTPEIVRTLLQAWDASYYAIFPTFDGVWGNPVLLGLEAIEDCAGLMGDKGARSLLLARTADCFEVQTQCEGVLFDVDLPKDFES